MKRYTETEETLMKSRDRKFAVLTEAVRGIRQIKFSSTERQWSDKIIKLRQIELTHQHAVFCFSLAMVAIWSFGPVCMSIMSLLVYVLVNHKITASTAFTAVSIFQGLQLTLSILPELLTELSDAAVSAHQVEKFLELQERGDDRLPGDKISFRKATITWPTEKSKGESEEEEDTFCLKVLCLDFPTGKLSVVSGRTGSGKTLLLQSIIGEAKVVEGSLTVPRRADDELNTNFNRQDWIDSGLIAYVSQDPWIENATIRESILFGLPFDAERYSEVLNACAPRDDLKTLTDGGMTVGTNGINLSGGQKWRVAFARALYSRAGILILMISLAPLMRTLAAIFTKRR